jgi:hypothetical protein
MRRLLLALPLTLLSVSAATACINDSDTVRTESEFKKHDEFKSGYREQTRPAEPSGVENGWMPLAATFSGFGLLMGAVALITINVRKTGGA